MIEDTASPYIDWQLEGCQSLLKGESLRLRASSVGGILKRNTVIRDVALSPRAKG